MRKGHQQSLPAAFEFEHIANVVKGDVCILYAVMGSQGVYWRVPPKPGASPLSKDPDNILALSPDGEVIELCRYFELEQELEDAGYRYITSSGMSQVNDHAVELRPLPPMTDGRHPVIRAIEAEIATRMSGGRDYNDLIDIFRTAEAAIAVGQEPNPFPPPPPSVWIDVNPAILTGASERPGAEGIRLADLVTQANQEVDDRDPPLP